MTNYPLPLSDKIRPIDTALLVIDLQNDFCHQDGVFGRLGASVDAMPGMLASVTRLVEEARRLGIMIVWIRATYDRVVRSPAFEDSLSKPGLTVDVCLEGTWGAEWMKGLCPDPQSASEVVLTKHRFSAFWDTAIDLFLRSNGIRTVVLTGVVTSGCVESTARDAFFRNYFVVMPSDTAASYSVQRHDASLRKIAHSMGEVPTSDQVLEIWAGHQPGDRNWHLENKLTSAPRALADIVAPEHTALLVIDLQNDFCHPNGVMAKKGADISPNVETVRTVSNILAAARNNGVLVVHVQANYGPQSASSVWIGSETEASVALELCLPSTWGAENVDELAPREGEPIVVKHRYSAFLDTRLETLLRSNGIKTIVATGTATMACVETTVRDAMMRDYRVVVPKEGVAARGHMKALHDTSLETMGLFFAKVVSTEQLMEAWPTASQ